MPVAAGAGRVDKLHRVGFETEYLRDRGAQRVEPLRMGPHGQDAAGEVGERGRWRERGVHLVGALVDRTHRARSIRRGVRHRLLARKTFPHRKALPRVAEEKRRHRPLVQSALRSPLRGRGHARRGPNRQVFVLCGHREKAAVAHEPRAFEVGFNALRKRGKAGVVVRRPHDPGVQYARGAKIVDESRRAGDVRSQMKRLDARRPNRIPSSIGERRGFWVDSPFTSTAHAPHCSRLQPTLTPVSPSRLRNASARGSSG